MLALGPHHSKPLKPMVDWTIGYAGRPARCHLILITADASRQRSIDRLLLQIGGVNRELSFGASAPGATAQQSQGNSSPVQHVESLGSWLGQGQTDATRRPSVKLSGPHDSHGA